MSAHSRQVAALEIRAKRSTAQHNYPGRINGWFDLRQGAASCSPLSSFGSWGASRLRDRTVSRSQLVHTVAASVAKNDSPREILVKPLNNPALGRGYLRVTTALPENNDRFVAALPEVVRGG